MTSKPRAEKEGEKVREFEYPSIESWNLSLWTKFRLLFVRGYWTSSNFQGVRLYVKHIGPRRYVLKERYER